MQEACHKLALDVLFTFIPNISETQCLRCFGARAL